MSNKSSYIKIYKYRLYPKKSQEKSLDIILDRTRYMYNKVLENIRQEKDTLNNINIQNYKNKYPALNIVDDNILLNAIEELKNDIIQNINNPEQFQSPRFKGRFQDQSFFAHTIELIKINNNDYIIIPYIENIDPIEIKLHCPLEGKILFAKLIYTPIKHFYILIFTENEYKNEYIDIIHS